MFKAALINSSSRARFGPGFQECFFSLPGSTLLTVYSLPQSNQVEHRPDLEMEEAFGT